MANPDNTKHLLVMRLSAMGDVAMTAPIIRALRNAYPELRITILTRNNFKAFFGGIDNIEFFIPDFDKRHKGMKGISNLFSDLKRLNIDSVADMHDVLRTKILSSLFRISMAQVAVIDKGRNDKRALTRKFRKHLVQLKPMTERYLEVLRKLGFDKATLSPQPKKIASIPAEIAERTGIKEGKWIGIAPFAKHKGKIYPTKHTDDLIGLLADKYEKVFVFGGGQYEKEFAEYMEIRHPGTMSVIGKLKLDREMDLMANLDCIITMDSATMHISSLVGTPVVSIWGATHPFAGFYGYGQDQSNAVQLDMECRPCSVFGDKPCMYKDYRCLEGIKPESILDKVIKVLDQETI